MSDRPQTSLPDLPAGYRLLRLGSVDSTNAEARRRANAGEKGPLWIWSLRQSAGRGRSGRDWHSHNGNLFASLLLTLACPLATAAQLALLAGVAAFDAVTALIGEQPTVEQEDLAAALLLKWPNDLLLQRKKLAGILIESAAASEINRCTVIIGTGINLVHRPEGLPQPAISLAECGVDTDAAAALQALATATDLWLKRWGEGASFQAIRRAWLERAGPTGNPITVKLPNGAVDGFFSGLDVSGALRLATSDGTERRITAGDVFFPSE